MTVRRGAGVGGSDRVTLTWADGAIVDTWLRVAARAGGPLNLPAPTCSTSATSAARPATATRPRP